jgi:hypothetical protein
VLVALADVGHREHRHRQRGRNELEGSVQDRLIDGAVDPDGQVRAMLLDRAHRKHGDDAVEVE